ncbi:hypothetical protein [Polaromonas sp. YR568]|uniref:hypothetical protein n=1 Tax=Polaromonas sp. YR568 TaxID=1855301 RepID=UPI003137D808
MTTPKIIPTPTEIGREAIIVLAGALVAAFIVGQLPPVREWIRKQWGPAPTPTDTL